MLVLTRRKNQSIVIGDGITVTVLEVKGDNVRLGITAPRDVQVFREELLTALSEANDSAVLPEAAAAAPAMPAPALPAREAVLPNPLRMGARRRPPRRCPASLSHDRAGIPPG